MLDKIEQRVIPLIEKNEETATRVAAGAKTLIEGANPLNASRQAFQAIVAPTLYNILWAESLSQDVGKKGEAITADSMPTFDWHRYTLSSGTVLMAPQVFSGFPKLAFSGIASTQRNAPEDPNYRTCSIPKPDEAITHLESLLGKDFVDQVKRREKVEKTALLTMPGGVESVKIYAESRPQYNNMVLGVTGSVESLIIYLNGAGQPIKLALIDDPQKVISSMLKTVGNGYLSTVLGILSPEEIERNQADQKLLSEAFSLPEGRYRDCPNPNEVRGILQHEYGITNAHSDRPIVGTFGLGPCIALTLYNAETRTAAIAHIDSLTDLNSLTLMVRDVAGTKSTPLEARLVGGQEMLSKNVAVQLLRYLKEKDINLIQADILDKPHPTNFSIDSRTGELIGGFLPTDLGKDVNMRITLVGLTVSVSRIRREYDGRKQTST